MDFKRTNNSTVQIDDFQNAEESKSAKNKPAKDKIGITIKYPRELRVKIRKKNPAYSLNQYLTMALIMPIENIKEEILATIYSQAKWRRTSMSEIVRFKMGLKEAPQPNDPNDIQHIKDHTIFLKQEEKDKIVENAKRLKLSIKAYSEIKIVADYELKDIFTFDELMLFKAEALNFDLDIDEYIAMRIKK